MGDRDRGRRFRPRPLDYVALALSVLTVVAAGVFAYGDRAEASEVSIESDEGTFLYPLDVDRLVRVDGPLGETVIEIEEGRVHVHESPCRAKICIAAGWLESTGQWTACLPNRVFVRVDGGESQDGVDAQTY